MRKEKKIKIIHVVFCFHDTDTLEHKSTSKGRENNIYELKYDYVTGSYECNCFYYSNFVKTGFRSEVCKHVREANNKREINIKLNMLIKQYSHKLLNN